MTGSAAAMAASTARAMVLPLVLAQFICSYAASSLNVAISSISTDLGTSVSGVQTAITIFTLTMAALMIPGSKLTDIWGRKVCFHLGLIVYGIGALIAAVAPGLPALIIGYSLLQGIGTALLIPPVYIFATVFFGDVTSRAKAFGAISAAGGIGAAAGPLIGGLITTTTSWRLSFVLQAVVVAGIALLGRKIVDAGVRGPKPRFDFVGAILSAAGLSFGVIGILLAGDYGWVTASQDVVVGSTVVIPQGGISPVLLFVAIGALLLVGFFWHIGRVERAGKEPLLSVRMFRDRVANLGLVTQNIQWLVLLGLSFVVSVYLQTARGYSAIETGLILTPATIGILVTSMAAGRLAQRYPQAILDPDRLRGHPRRPRAAPPTRERHVERPDVRARPSAGRSGRRPDAHLVGQRRAVELRRGGPGRDLGPVAQRLQPGLIARGSDRRQRRGLATGDRQRRIRSGHHRARRVRGGGTGGGAVAALATAP